ncbi:hypothetical protein UCRPA7_7766 [Phaeoacremonium minimum UCRPA7]|uniref:Uncharacterized protein n=1 Tax=Phaeoacremonium minimum (strain UCR-PA7) TaxID=1286976 RepID=R8BBL8_PHAM7|nr:hypothetical protein UCRPA7_7766 [Phaeoacremonium minimum UCRPA7]EON96733.1 hypothetical protein UCRPA7_7766 [Phaeoacremonium minimum UCRPA7]
MGQAEAAAVNQAKALVWDSNMGNQGGQLGVGIYCTTFSMGYLYENWHASLTATSSSKWANVKKAWIPQQATVNGQNLNLFSNEQNIVAYLTSLGLDPARTVRMAKQDDYIQYLLPPALVTGNPLSIKAVAVQGLETIGFNYVDYTSWANIVNPEAEPYAVSY